MAEVKAVQKQPTVKVIAKYAPFDIVPTGQVVNDPAGTVVPLDGWVQANIDNGLLIVCS